MNIKSPLSVYDFLGSKAGGSLGKFVYEGASKQKAFVGKQDTHDPELKVQTYEFHCLLTFLMEFRSNESNKSKVDSTVWDAIASRAGKYNKALEAENQPALF